MVNMDQLFSSSIWDNWKQLNLKQNLIKYLREINKYKNLLLKGLTFDEGRDKKESK